MELTVRLFAAHADQYGTRSLVLTLDPPVTVAAIQAAIRDRLSGFPEKAAIAVNAEYATPELMVTEHDEIAIIPPVAGG
jgi:molybdopterin converting factor small subunit